jgi:hypothetical protein
VFIFFCLLIFIFFHSLFWSYFEADEWFHFTYYLPLTKRPDGFLTAIIYNFIHTDTLSAGEHITPIASIIYFLNTKFFGLYYPAYAFMSLLFHAVNSFLTFLLIRTLLNKKEIVQKNIFALLSGLFFALAPTPLHTITSASPFYGENILSLTFVLLCILFFKNAFIKKNKKYLYFCLLFLFCALFSKETAGYLFLLLPSMAMMEKRIFPLKFLSKMFIFSLMFYILIRFLIPNVHLYGQILDKLAGSYMPSSYQSSQALKPVDTGTIVSHDLSIHKNLPAEIFFRTLTFPLKMMGTLFLPRSTEQAIVQTIAPLVVPVPPGGDQAKQTEFSLGSGNYVIIYFVSISIFIFLLFQIKNALQKKQKEDARIVALGIAIVVFSSLPLVFIIFAFPRWGYDYYFDSRYYYHSSVGASIIFPFLLFGIARLISKLLRGLSIKSIAAMLFIIWLIYNFYIVSLALNQLVNRYSFDRRDVASQIVTYLPKLPEKTVFYTETDGNSIYGPILPFQTSVPQALTVIYYNKSPLPDSFFNKTIIDGKPEGYEYKDGRGFGYYTSKKTLADDLSTNKFSINNIYAFYYYADKAKLTDNTQFVRKEMGDYLEKRKEFTSWKLFEASPSAGEKITFLYPQDVQIMDYPIATTEAKILKDLQISSPQFTAMLKIIRIIPTLDINEMTAIFGKINNSELPIAKKVALDKYHFNEALVAKTYGRIYYIIKFDDLIVSAETLSTDQSSIEYLEKILGSITFSKI